MGTRHASVRSSSSTSGEGQPWSARAAARRRLLPSTQAERRATDAASPAAPGGCVSGSSCFAAAARDQTTALCGGANAGAERSRPRSMPWGLARAAAPRSCDTREVCFAPAKISGGAFRRRGTARRGCGKEGCVSVGWGARCTPQRGAHGLRARTWAKVGWSPRPGTRAWRRAPKREDGSGGGSSGGSTTSCSSALASVSGRNQRYRARALRSSPRSASSGACTPRSQDGEASISTRTARLSTARLDPPSAEVSEKNSSENRADASGLRRGPRRGLRGRQRRQRQRLPHLSCTIWSAI